MDGLAEHRERWLEIAGNGYKLLEMTRMAKTGWILLEIAGNYLKWLIIEGGAGN